MAVSRTKRVMAEGEDLSLLLDTEQRVIAVTSERLILIEKNIGGATAWSATQLRQIALVEVFANGSLNSVKLIFAGGAERTVGTSSYDEAIALANAVTVPR